MPKLNILDVSTTIGCNLSCKGCNHFSNYFSPGSKLDTDALLRDIRVILPRLDIDRVSIIGGEPLLNPRCEEILHECRSHTRNAVYLYTNGLLLLQNESWIRRALDDPQIYLRVSVHLPEVVDIIKKFNHPKVLVTEHHTGKDRWFDSIRKRDGKVYPYTHNNISKSYKICSCPNAQLYNGRLWKCPNTAFLRELLSVTGQSDDDEWQDYIVDGVPVDCSDDELTKFCTNSRIAENVCNMCTAKPLHFSAAIQDSINKSLATTHANIPTKKFENR